MGAFAYITKPFSLNEVEQVVERALGQKAGIANECGLQPGSHR
jgi:DNA-binding NtrC family response regulator